MKLTPDQEREAEASAVKECAKMSDAFFPDAATTCRDRCLEKHGVVHVADDCPFIAQAKLALFGWVNP